MSLSFRRAAAVDLETIIEMDRRSPTGANWSRAQFEAELGEGFLVAVRLEEIVGYAVFRRVAGESQLYAIAVAPEYRRHGYGSRLLDEIFARSRDARCSRVSLEVRADNEAAVAFYKKRGFVVVGRRLKYYNGVADALQMDASLS